MTKPRLAERILNTENSFFETLSFDLNVSSLIKSLNSTEIIRYAYTLYIGVPETEAILLSPVRKRVIDVFTRVNSFASKTYDEESRAVAALPNVQQLVLMLNK
ncbi:hypothetical protein B9Z55_001013 [Caenorhabditis nigoni]|uniref:Uncharacterized protein n=1 Tax=Caenorhabditis nigoni TaxID=1611254 RepID=A0A2G5VDZ6_9PELO|nr:hypothetical protein B9Z55_001013 [Caenorhabditis nigoni]